MREVTVYSCGDSNDLKTWSNVPYFFCRSLEEFGIRVNRVDISPNRFLKHLFNSISFLFFKRIFKRRACPEFMRTPIHRFIINRRLKKASRDFPNSELNLFLSFGFINKFNGRPNILWCDWTDRIVIERQGREPAWFERGALKHEDSVIRMADKVFSMFPVCKEHMEELYKRGINYINRNVVNNAFPGEIDRKNISQNHFKSQNLLFIGGIKYLDGLYELIKVMDIVREVFPQLRLSVIGLNKKDIEADYLKEWIDFYGYLDKGNNEENGLYYKLLMDSRIMINPTANWGGYSSTIEAMYFGCPVIVSPYEDFVKEMGEDIDFGLYTNGDLNERIHEILSLPEKEYMRISENAFRRVESYTWHNYVEEFLKEIESWPSLNIIYR